jgi:hypothetical protein
MSDFMAQGLPYRNQRLGYGLLSYFNFASYLTNITAGIAQWYSAGLRAG